MNNSQEPISFSYAVLSFVIDHSRSITMPIGVALWSKQRQWADVRFVKEKERLKGFSQQDHFPFVQLAEEKLRHWMASGALPHCEQSWATCEDAWWQHVRKLLIHRVRLSEPRPIDCHDPEQELEPLYDAVVSPHRAARDVKNRIDGEITKCLDGLSEKFKSRTVVPGFGGRNVKVLRAYHGGAGWVVIEGVNLAITQAEVQLDATVSRLQRLRKGVEGKERCELLIGYLASPEGLNGEAVLVDWVKQATGAKTFDLLRERDSFRHKADELVAEVDEQELLFK